MTTTSQQRPTSTRRLKYPEYFQNNRRINTSLTLQDYQTVLAWAKHYGVAIAVFLREAAFAFMRKKYLVPKNIEAKLSELIYQIGKIGDNIDQLLLRANTLKKATFYDLYQADKLLKEMQKKVEQFITNPPRSVRNDHQNDTH